jgi:hypothetical protein
LGVGREGLTTPHLKETPCYEKSHREDKIGEECSTHGDMRNTYKTLIGKCEGKRQLRRTSADGNLILEWIFGK